MQPTQSSNSNPTVTYTTPGGQSMTSPLNEAPPQVQLLYQQLPQAQAQTSTAQSGAISAGAGAKVAQVQAKQAPAQIDLGADLAGKMTLDSALKKYTPLGKTPDEIFNQYLASSPYGLPNESPQDLMNKGISATALGAIGTPGSFMDRFNTKNAIAGLRDLQDKWGKTNAASRLASVFGLSNDTSAYDNAKTILGAHLSSLIPGASSAQATGQSFTGMLPNAQDPREDIPGKASAQFNSIEDQLLKTKGYSYKDLGLPTPDTQPAKPTTGGGLLKGLLQIGLPTAGAVGGGILGGVGGALVPGADLTGVPEVAGAMAGSGVGGAGGQALADILTGKKPGGDVALTGLLSAGGEGVGAGIGALLGKVGGGVADYGANLISKNLNLTPKMASDVAGEMGVKSVPQFLAKEGLQGANYEKVSSAVEPIQAQFDAIAKNPNIKIAPSNVINGFQAQIKTLQDSILPADHTKAKMLQTISDNFAAKFKDVPQIGADALTTLRQTVDKGIKDWGANPEVAGTGSLTRNVLQKSIQDADPSNSLDALGTKLRQYYTLIDKVEPRQFASAAKPILGVRDVAAALFGNALAGPPGAAGIFGLEKLLGTGPAINATSKGAMGLGKMLGSGVLKGAIKTGGATTGGGIGAMLGIGQ